MKEKRNEVENAFRPIFEFDIIILKMVENCKPLMNDQQPVNTIVDCPVSCVDFGSFFFMRIYVMSMKIVNGRQTVG
jgi:hypothetical protein